MIPRHKLEIALEDDIRNHYYERAHDIIALINKPAPDFEKNPPSLDSFDEYGRSFLYIALEEKNIPIARQLLSIQKNNDGIVFAKTNNDATIFHAAAFGDCFELIDELVHAAENIGRVNDDYKQNYKYWLNISKRGHSPLMRAIADGHLEVAKKLLSIILQETEETANLIFKQLDDESYNLLHFVFMFLNDKNADNVASKIFVSAKLINLLMPYFDLKDFYISYKAISPFSCFSVLPIDTRAALFTLFDTDVKEIVLFCYRKYLYYFHPLNKNSGMDDKAKKNYFILASLLSLKSYLIAVLEFGPIVLKECHHRDINALIPRYTKRLALANIDAELAATAANAASAVIAKTKKIAGHRNAKWVKQDLKLLAELIGHIDAELLQIKDNETAEYYNNKHILMLGGYIFILFLPSLQLFASLFNFIHKKSDIQLPFDMVFYLSVISMVGATIHVTSTKNTIESNYKKMPENWKSAAQHVQVGLLSRLSLLNDNESQEKILVKNRLRRDVQELAKVNNRPEAARLFTHLSTTLKDLRNEVELTKKPFIPRFK